MKKALLAACALAFAASPVMAQDDDFMTVSGTIDYNCDVTFGGQNTASVNFVITGDQPLGVARIVCNDPDGLRLSIRSFKGRLESPGGTYSRDYTLSQAGGDNPSLAFGPHNPATGDTTVQVVNAAGFQLASADSDGSTHQISMNLAVGGNTLPGGVSLSDTIVWIINGI